MNITFDFKLKQELQENLMDMSYEKFMSIKKSILSSNFWKLNNDNYLQFLSFNILNSVTYRPKSIQLFSQLVFDLINSDSQIGENFRRFLLNFLTHSISQDIIYPYRYT